MKELADVQARTFIQRLLSVIRREPDSVAFATDNHLLPYIENQDAERGFDRFQLAVTLGNQVDVGDTGKPIPNVLPARRDFNLLRRWLHPGLNGTPPKVWD